jgi:hypothetical protein
MWCIKRTNIYLGDEQTQLLDRIAAEEGVPRAELVRRLIDRALTGSQNDLAADLAAIDDSFGVLQDVDQPMRGRDGRDEHLARMWQVAA